jgi:spermidine/putrescine transport system permease protein
LVGIQERLIAEQPSQFPAVMAISKVASMTKPARKRIDAYAMTWRLPIIVWQLLFFVGPLLFMLAMSFFVVKNYRMVEAFDTASWVKMLGRGYFWDSYFLTLWLAMLSTTVAMVIAFPAAYALAFRVSDNVRRWAIFLLIIPFFTSYLVRIFSWYVILAETGVVNSMLAYIGLGPYTMLNTKFGTIVGYLTLTLPLVVILQTFAMANIDNRLVEAACNLGCKPFATVYRVVIPLAKTGLIIAALFCFILSFGDFVSPYYLGGSKPPTLSILIIDTTKSGQQWPRAAVVAIMMMVTLFAVAFAAIATAYAKRGKS